MTRKHTIIVAAAAALAAGGGTAGAAINHIVGHEGEQVKLDAMCRREVTPAPGETLEFSVNVIGQQVHCLIRRPDPFARCVKRLANPIVEKADHGPGKPGDEVGARKFAAKVIDCASAHL
jgi:hypothetical protein